MPEFISLTAALLSGCFRSSDPLAVRMASYPRSRCGQRRRCPPQPPPRSAKSPLGRAPQPSPARGTRALFPFHRNGVCRPIQSHFSCTSGSLERGDHSAGGQFGDPAFWSFVGSIWLWKIALDEREMEAHQGGVPEALYVQPLISVVLPIGVGVSGEIGCGRG